MWWWHGHWFGVLGALIWLAAVAYLLTLATRLVRAIEQIAAKFESKPG
jgi:Flp pilus assembly pilin Flp